MGIETVKATGYVESCISLQTPFRPYVDAQQIRHNTGEQMSAGVGLIQHGSFLTLVCTTPGLGVVHLSCSCAMLVAPLCKLVGGKNASKQRYKMLSEHIVY